MGDLNAEAELVGAPKLPPMAAHIWGWWVDLCATRGSGGFGMNPLSRVEIQAWERDEGNLLEPWERRAILKLDATYRTTMAPDAEGGT